MDLLSILFVAVGLAMDAFAVSVAEGMALERLTGGHVLRVALHFGGFQAIMPVVGWLGGMGLRRWVSAYDHWVAFGLLFFLGCKMLVGAFWRGGTERRPPSTGGRLIALSLATSLDAFAVGVSLAMLRIRILGPALIIGLVTGLLCAGGVWLGDRAGARLGRWAEVLGGAVLCGIGLEILWRHLGGSGL